MSVHTDAVPSTNRKRPRVSFSVDEAIVLLGVLRMSPTASDPTARALGQRVVDRVATRVSEALLGYNPAPHGDVVASDDVVGLARLLRAGLDDLDGIVAIIEERTDVEERPIVLVAASQVASRALAFRINRLAGD